jgi:hypothetical protein
MEIRQQVEEEQGHGEGGVGEEAALAVMEVGIIDAVVEPDEYSLESLGNLSAQFQEGLYYIHNSWRDPIRKISSRLWEATAGEDARVAVINHAAFTILPGVISAIRKLSAGVKPIEFLVAISNSADPAMVILGKAKEIIAERDFRGTGRAFRPPSIADLARQVEKKVDQDQLSAAAAVVDRITEVAAGVPQQPPMSLQDLRAKIAQLNPPADEDDILPPEEEDPDGFKVTEEDALNVMRRLDRKSTTGCNGWTNRAIMFIWGGGYGDDVGRASGGKV